MNSAQQLAIPNANKQQTIAIPDASLVLCNHGCKVRKTYVS